MKIRFEKTLEDLVAFNNIHHANSPTTRRQRFQAFLVAPAVLVVLYLLGIAAAREVRQENPTVFVLIWTAIGMMCILASIAWFFFIRWYWPWMIERNVRKLFAEGSNRSVLGWIEMELANGRLATRTELSEGSFDLRAIDRIVSNERYTFVYIASLSALVIPMNLYPEDKYRQFVAELREAWENRDVAPPANLANPRVQPEEGIVKRPR